MKLRTEAQIDTDALRDLAAETESSRRFLAVLWGFVLAFTGAAALYSDPMGLTMSFLGGFVVLLLTLAMGKLTIDERLHRTWSYRIASGGFFAVAGFGVVLAAMPRASDASQLLAVYFGIVGLMAYRAVVSRGPRAALQAIAIAMILVVPFVFLSLLGCHRGRVAPSWTAAASYHALEAVLVLIPILAIITLLAFRPRHDFVPDARVLRQRQPG